MTNRRNARRMSVDLFFNKYLDGYPYLCRGVNLSSQGLLARTFSEPLHDQEAFSLELRLPGDKSSLWLWARGVWRRDELQAIRFVQPDRSAQDRLARYLVAA